MILSTSCTDRAADSYAEAPQVESDNLYLEESAYEDSQVMKAQASSGQPMPQKKSDRKIINRAELRYQVDNLEKGHQSVTDLIKKHEGYVSSMYEANHSYEHSTHWALRVPQERFESLLKELKSISIHLDYQRISTDDVTAEFIDIEKRLASKRMLRDRYEEILRTQAKDLAELIEAERAILAVQEEIEAKEGRLKYLKDQVAMSSITLEMYEKVEYVETPASYHTPFFTKVKDHFAKGWEVVQGLALIIIALWPFLLLFLIVYLMRGKIVSYLPWTKKTAGGLS